MIRERNHQIDNAKAGLIFLVIFGHLIEPYIAKDTIFNGIYSAIYTFHMPMFVFISGMLSKRNFGDDYIVRNIVSLVIPFILFQIFYEALEYYFYGSIASYTLNIRPYWILWYLWCLIFWRHMLVVFRFFRFPIVISIVLAILAGYVYYIGYYLSFSRILVFFPIFLAGHYLGTDFFSKLRFKGYFLIYPLILIAILCVFLYVLNINPRWMYGSMSYESVGCKEWYAGGYRFGLLLLSLIVGFSFIGLMPQRKNYLTGYGKNVLFVYLWHGFFVKGLVWSGITMSILKYGRMAYMGFSVLVSVALFCLLSNSFVSHGTDKYIIRPFAFLLLAKRKKQIA
ncbi:MAG: acyltransferase family protein [Candidatus Kuenenia sp.]|nr:acyltransferase family protein [Candidatus Kuenenia hertensis]